MYVPKHRTGLHHCHNARDWLTLISLPGLGCALIHRLVDDFGSPGQVLVAGSSAGRVAGIGLRTVQVFTDAALLTQARNQADNQLEYLKRSNISLTCRDDSRYPDLLKTIHDPPAVLFYQGNLDCLTKPTVAIIGSRAATSYGKQVGFSLARELAGQGGTVVSGLAYGIDAQAHKGALAGSGSTVGVLGCGVDVVYPRGHAELYRQCGEHGAVVSEYPPGTPPDGFRFPARNRIISGLSLGVVVVEATLKSGSLITARLALDQGREVFAVPGRIDSAKSAGAHRLLQQGAHLVHRAQDILDELGLAAAMHLHSKPDGSKEATAPADSAEQQLLSCLDVYPLDIDTILRVTGFDIAVVHDLLLRLELKGLVRQLPGQQYERTHAD
ncbi:MAG: DNA-protecting protein DprA [Desulfobulbaceae bacterium]|nr:DNA-protecting protein DprA [Desulfobulbaceae bacterium]